jgi:hypothetical protein
MPKETKLLQPRHGEKHQKPAGIDVSQVSVMSDRVRKMLKEITPQQELAMQQTGDVDQSVQDEALIVDDVDFDASSNTQQIVTKTPDATITRRQRESRQQREQHAEERQQTSRRTIVFINGESKKLARSVDAFIDNLRHVANDVDDNPHLCRRFETLRRTCVSFIRLLETQLPGLSSSLFVEGRE